MAGHSKWAQIKRQKGSEDAKRSKVFSRFSRLISVEAKLAKGDLNAPGLRNAISRAKALNMPQNTIDRAVEKGTGGSEGNLLPVLYEAYGPKGCALLIEGFTENKNKSAQEVKHALSLFGSTLSTPGSVVWAFSKEDGAYVAKTNITLEDADKEKLSDLIEALDALEFVQEIYTNTQTHS